MEKLLVILIDIPSGYVLEHIDIKNITKNDKSELRNKLANDNRLKIMIGKLENDWFEEDYFTLDMVSKRKSNKIYKYKKIAKQEIMEIVDL